MQPLPVASAAESRDPGDPDVDLVAVRRARVVLALGVLMLWLGVVPWLAVGLGAEGYPSVFHSIAQVQGFLLSFAVGLLWLAVSEAGGGGPSRLGFVLCLLCPVGVAGCAALEEFGWSQSFWFVQAGWLTRFVARQRKPLGAALPGIDGVLAGLLFGVVGSILFGIYGALGPDAFKVHEVAKGCLLQGMFLALLAGVASFWWPRILGRPVAGRWSLAWVLGLSLLFAGSVGLEVYGGMPGAGLVIRAVVAAVVLRGAGLGAWPPRSGLSAGLVWAMAWSIPLGYLWAGIFPDPSQAGLHLVFLLGFAGSALVLSLEVLGAEAGGTPRQDGLRTALLGGLGLALVCTAAARVAMVEMPSRYGAALLIAAGGMLVASLFWGVLARRAISAVRGRR